MAFDSSTEPRYQIREVIGRGGMGEVCLADDLMLDRQVALKFLTSPGESDLREQALTEARAAAALDHPFICSIYEVTVLEGRPCIVMEYVRGETLEHRLRGGPLSVSETLRIAEEIAEALDAAHKRRVVHRDLKPANVMLTEDGHAKVMDFGLATRLPVADAIDPGSTTAIPPEIGLIRGTPAYMAPEQIRGETVDRRCDLFAFGILLYELLSGRNPFARVGVEATLTAILTEPAPALRDSQSSIPPPLHALIAQLLAKDAATRHGSFAEVRTILRRVAVGFSSRATHPSIGPVDRVTDDPGSRLIGRDTERAQLLQALEQARSGRGTLVLLLGDAGMGKTRLAEETLAAARQLGYQTLVGRCHEREGTPPLIPYIEALEEAARLMPPALFRQAVGQSAPELAKLMPELVRLLDDIPKPLELPPHLQQRFLFTSFRDFLTRAGQAAPVVMFVDDLQWADETTLQLTELLAQQIASLPIVLFVAYRETDHVAGAAAAGRVRAGEALAAQQIKVALDRLVAQRHARAIQLRAFTQSDVQSLLTMLGRPQPPGRLVRQFTEHTGGNPFFVAELFRHLNEEGLLFDAHDQWKREIDLDDVEIPDTVRTVLESRVLRVSPETQNVLKAAALIGRQFDPDLLEQVADVDSDRLSAALSEAEQARILKGPSGRRDVTWRFAHQLICQTLSGAIPHLRRQRLHLRVADAMERLDPTSRRYASGIAHHLYCAGSLADPGRTASALIRAGDNAFAIYAVDEAVQHYRRALDVLQDVSADDGSKLRVQERLGDLLALTGERAAAMTQFEAVGEACRAAQSVVDQARIARKIGTLHWYAGNRAEAMTSYGRALENLSGSAGHLEAAHLYQEFGVAAFRSGDNAKAIEWAERALEAAEQALLAPAADAARIRKEATTAIAQATNTIGVALARSGQVDAARERIERSLAAAQEMGLLDVACRAYANLGVLYCSVEPKRAIDVSLTGLEIASRIGAASLQSYIYANLAAAYCALTDRCETEGLEAARAAESLDRELGQLDHLAVPLVVIAQIHQCRGELQKAYDAYVEALALAEKISEPQLILPCYDGLATIHLDRGDPARAQQYLEKARQLCERSGLDPDTLLLLPFLC